MTDQVALIVSGTLAVLCGLAWHLGMCGLARSVERSRRSRAASFWSEWISTAIVLLLVPGTGALVAAWVFLDTLLRLVLGPEWAPPGGGHVD